MWSLHFDWKCIVGFPDHDWFVIFIQQAGNTRHEHICEAIELFAREVIPELHEGEDKRLKRKAEELAPYIEAALARKKRMPALKPAQVKISEKALFWEQYSNRKHLK